MIPPAGVTAQAERFRADLLALCGQLRIDGPFGLAVSGGPDSLGLLLLAHAAFPGEVEAATVDHGLRDGSADEAAAVGRVCAGLGVRHEIIRLGVFDRSRGVQAGARDARYHGLGAWCGRRRLPLLLTAHHADDQAETLLLRLARGSGLAGMRGIRPWRELRPALAPPAEPTSRMRHVLLRPLLRWSRAELARIVDAAGLVAADDPGNDDPRFDRTRARRLLRDADWLKPGRIAAVAAHMADADDALGWAVAQECGRRIREDRPGVTLDPAGLPPEMLRRVVARALDVATASATAGGRDRCLATGPEIATLIARLQAGDHATLGLVKASPGPRWLFTEAPPRRSSAA